MMNEGEEMKKMKQEIVGGDNKHNAFLYNSTTMHSLREKCNGIASGGVER